MPEPFARRRARASRWSAFALCTLAPLTAASASSDGFETTLPGGLELYHVPDTERGAVLLRIDRGLAHAAYDREAEVASAAFLALRGAADAELAWQGRLDADAVLLWRDTDEGLENALRELASRLLREEEPAASAEDDETASSDAATEASSEDQLREPAWDRFRETAFPLSEFGTARAEESDVEPDAITDFLRREWGPEEATLVILGGGEHGGVHRLASECFAGWPRATRPRREFSPEPAPRRARVVPAPGSEGWIGYRLSPRASLEDRLCCEAALATLAEEWPRGMTAAGVRLLGVPTGAEPWQRRDALRDAIDRGGIEPSDLRAAWRARADSLGRGGWVAAADLARAAAEEGDPRARDAAMRRLLAEDDAELEQRVGRLVRSAPPENLVIVAPSRDESTPE